MTKHINFITETKALIDNLKAVCANYGLGNDGNKKLAQVSRPVTVRYLIGHKLTQFFIPVTVRYLIGLFVTNLIV